jgi:hypothetical protein
VSGAVAAGSIALGETLEELGNAAHALAASLALEADHDAGS